MIKLGPRFSKSLVVVENETVVLMEGWLVGTSCRVGSMVGIGAMVDIGVMGAGVGECFVGL